MRERRLSARRVSIYDFAYHGKRIILYNDNRLREGRWPVIIFLRIFAFSGVFDVFSLPEFPRDPSLYLDKRNENVHTVIITPSYTADVSACCLSREGVGERFCEFAAYCAGVFMYELRGLPNDCLEVETSREINKVTREQKDEFTSIILPKCKVLYSNKRENVDDTELFVSAVSFRDRIFKLVTCTNAEHFSDVALRALLRSGIGDSIDGVAAYSMDDGGADIRYLLRESCSEFDVISAFLTVAQSEYLLVHLHYL